MSSAWFQLPVHNAAPPSLHGVREGRSPASTLLWGAATPCRPFRRASFPSLGDTIVASVVRPPPAPDAEPWINLELVGGISSRLARWKRQGLPSSRRNPCDHSPYSSDPGVTRQAEWTMSKLPDAAPATDHDEGSPRCV